MSRVASLLEFLDTPAAVLWSLTPQEAVAFLEGKGLQPTFDYRQMLGDEHARAFTVAKMMDTDLLADVKASLDDAIANGVPFKEWSDTLIPKLQAKGWWGRKAVNDPLTGNTIVAQLGSPSRLQTIYRTNMQSAYAAGNWDAIVDQAEVAPLLLYDAIDDFRTRPEHHAWDNTLLPVDDPWWRTHYPPNGWNCRCSVIQLSEDEAAELGLAQTAKAPDDGTYTWQNPATGKTSKIPNGLDPGWNSNVGIARQQLLAKAAADKVAGYEAAIQDAAAKGLAAAQEAGKVAARVTAATELATAADAATVAAQRAERHAKKAIAKAVQEKTPFLHKAIQAIQSTKSGQALSAKALHTAALAKAAKTEQDVAIYQWKVAYAAGKKPPAKAAAIFDKLDESVQLEIKAQVDVAKAAAQAAQAEEAAKVAAEQAAQAAIEQANANAAAQAKLEQLSQGTLVEKAAVKNALQASLSGTSLSPTELLAKAEAEIVQVKASQAAAGIKSATKKALVDGKIPSPAQQKYLAELTPEAKASFLADVDKAKAAKAPPGPDPLAPATTAKAAAPVAPPAAASAELDTTGFVQIGPQKGSNAGGLFQDPTTGDKWYIKTPASLDHARNEVLASKLYELAGAQVPELRLTTLNGKPAVASRLQDGLVQSTAAQLAKAAGAKEYFGVDAWLGNWDVGGASLDNLLLKNGQAFRVDVGGSLRYRAQGGLKGAAWGDQVTELDSLRNAGTNPQTAKVFGKMTQAELKAAGERVLRIDMDEVDDLIDAYGPLDPAERATLKSTLRKRMDSIEQQLKLERTAAPPAPELVPGGKHVTAQDFARIREARANGYTISTDGGHIEDHQVLLQHYTDAAGKAKTRLVTKLRGDGAKAALQSIGTAAGSGPPVLELGELRQAITALGKSINSRAAKGGTWDATIDTRLAEYRRQAQAARAKLQSAPFAAQGKPSQAILDQVDGFIESWVGRNGPGEAIGKIEVLAGDLITDVKGALPKAAKQTGGIRWTAGKGFEYRTGVSKAGSLIENGAHSRLPGVSQAYEGWTANSDARVRFIPDTSANAISSRGLLHIEVDGNTLASAEKAIDTLKELGVTTTRTTEGERVGLYLDKLLNLRTLKPGAEATKLKERWSAIDAIKDEAARNKAKLELLNKEVGYDLTKSPHWNPEGVYQAFGHGRTLQMRPDLDGPAMAAFERDHAIYTNVTGMGVGASQAQWDRLLAAIDGGGQLSSQVERARRGLASGGTSVEADHRSGGANYIFTRILKRTSDRFGRPGVYFKPNIIRRVDAFSYPSDSYGSVAPEVQATRAIDPAGFTRNAGIGSNETNFRDSLSLFDDLERIVFTSKAEQLRAIADMKARGYTTWPDGRKLEDVLQAPGKK